MSKGERFHRLVFLLEKHSLQDLKKYLPSPDFVRNIITFTNTGRVEEALFMIDKTIYVFTLLQEELSFEDREWYSEIIRECHRAIHQLRIEATQRQYN